MSDTATNGSFEGFLLDGDAPRLGVAAPMRPAPSILDYEALAAEPTSATATTAGDPGMLPAPRLGAEPVLLALDGPSLPAPAVIVPSAPSDPTEQSDAPAEHPMAHLMPGKAKPTEASIRAAQARAAKKAKARKIKILVGVVCLAFAVVVGPPLGKWLANAIDESGRTSSDEPAVTVPATTAASATTAPAASATTAPEGPVTTPPAGVTGLAGLPGEATAVVAEVKWCDSCDRSRDSCADHRSLIAPRRVTGSGPRGARGHRPAPRAAARRRQRPLSGAS